LVIFNQFNNFYGQLYCAENRPDESFFVKLDSNLKRNTAFVKKLVSLIPYLLGYGLKFPCV